MVDRIVEEANRILRKMINRNRVAAAGVTILDIESLPPQDPVDHFVVVVIVVAVVFVIVCRRRSAVDRVK